LLNVVMLNVVMLGVIMLSVIVLGVVMLSVVLTLLTSQFSTFLHSKLECLSVTNIYNLVYYFRSKQEPIRVSKELN
jgi:hypothetical protein